jgi:hypothetical protein
MKLRAALVLAGGVGRALAQDDQAALDLADNAPPSAQAQVHDWRLTVEGAFERSSEEPGGTPSRNAGRLSLDLHYDPTLATGLHAVLADRLDVNQQSPYGTTEVNTLKEAYLSWQVSQEQILDLGRINVRNGVALAYNPTDYFKDGAIRQVDSIDPSSLRENRLGSEMLRAQSLWSGGSVTALVSPRLQETPSEGPFSVDLGATNSSNRWLVALSQRLAQDLAPQLLVEGEEHHSPQVGLNLTHLLGQATVAYVEVSTGRSQPLTAQALGENAASTQVTRLAGGLSYTTPGNLFLTLEYERNEAALTDSQWAQLAEQSLPAFERALAQVASSQDLPDRQAMLALAQWTNAGVRHLDLSGFMRVDLADHSRLGWLEARYHWQRMDVALQWQVAAGAADTIYGHVTPSALGQLLVDVYLP